MGCVMSRCVIIGGAGFIASHLADDLLNNGHEVVLFSRENRSLRNVAHLSSKATFVFGDFTNGDGVEEAVKNADFVFHLAVSSFPGESIDPMEDAGNNILGSIKLMQICIEAKIKKLIFVSSGGAVYGATREIQISEDHPTNPISSYGTCKLTVEKFLEVYRNRSALDYTILRVSNPYGERHNPMRGHGLIGVLLYKVKMQKKIEIWGNGNSIRDYVYVGDVARALRMAIETTTDHRIFNIGSSIGHSINDIIQVIKEVTEAEMLVDYVGPRDFDVPSNILNSKKAYDLLGWRAETRLSDGIKKTWNWMRNIDDEFFLEKV